MSIIHDGKNYGTLVKLQGGGPAPVLESIIFTSNGTHHPEEGIDGWNEVTVQVSGPTPVSEGQFWIQNDTDSEQVIYIKSPVKGFQTSPDNTDWSEPTGLVLEHSFNIASRQKLYIKIDQIENAGVVFETSGDISIGGNASTLFNKWSQDCYNHLISAPNSSQVDISNVVIDVCNNAGHYSHMFAGLQNPMGFPQFSCSTVSESGFDGMFDGAGIQEIPTGLFANIQTINGNSFSYMFAGTPITTVPVDLIRHLKLNSGDRPFPGMFNGSHLQSVPEGFLDGSVNKLGALFEQCRFLESVPDNLIENIEVGDNSFSYMFNGCSSLVQAPKLPMDNKWGSNSYSGMFNACTSLVQAPEIWAEWRAGSHPQESGAVFYEMFGSCSSLIKGAKMHWNGPTSDGDRFRLMYAGCDNLEEVWADFTQVDGDVAWLNDQFTPKSRILHVTSGTSDMYSDRTQFVSEAWTIVEDYTPEYLPATYNMLKFTNLGDVENSLHIGNPSEIPFVFEQSMNGIDWSPLPIDGNASVDISFSDAIYIRSESGFGSHGLDWEEWRSPRFNCTENFKVGGEINKLDKSELAWSFNSSSTIIDASEIVINENIISNWDPNFVSPFNGTFNSCPNLQRVFTIPDISSNGYRQFEEFLSNTYNLRELRVEISNATTDTLRWIARDANSSVSGFTLYKKFGSGVLTDDRMTIVYI